MEKIKNIFKILIAQALTVVVILSIVALVGQIYAFLNPSYENIDVIPDRQLGWKLVPNSIFTYTGVHWYKNEFKTQIKINSLGFRDKERNLKKQKDLIRMAVIGDSFVVAREVPFDKTPSQLLESYLNESSVSSKFEVLNFGVTGFGIQQNLLTNRIYVKDFAPKYVFLFIFEDTFWRAVSISHAITSTMNQNQKLHIRPTFDMLADNLQELIQILNFKEFHQYLVQLEKNKLDLGKNFHFSEEEYLEFILKQRSLVTRGKIAQISEKLKSMELRSYGPYDFNKFVTLQNQVINSKFDGRRTRVREQKLFILGCWSKLLSDFQILKKSFRPELIMQNEMEKLLSIYSPEKGSQDLFSGSVNFPNFEKTLFINLKTIEVMRNDVESYGGNLVIVDAISNRIQKGRLPANLLSRVLEYYCIENKIGYIPLYEDLNIENSNGNKTSWAFDGHFNELGTQIFAESMYRWLQNKGVGASLNN
jgi:hypothetical protein